MLTSLQNAKGETSAIMIDAVSMMLGQSCQGATFKEGQTYDFYIINISEDEHPMHIHLVNFQVIGRFDFDVAKYQNDWWALNGGKPGPRGYTTVPKQLDVRSYQTSPMSPPKPEE